MKVGPELIDMPKPENVTRNRVIVLANVRFWTNVSDKGQGRLGSFVLYVRTISFVGIYK